MEQPKSNKPDIRIRVTVLIKDQNGKICFARHKKNDRRYWLLPGGGQDFCEKAMKTAARELEEELRISVKNFRLLFIRETMDISCQRHIQFIVFEGIDPDFSRMSAGDDPRVEGVDFFSADEIAERTIYPAMTEDILAYSRGESPELFKTLEWIP